MLDKLVKEHIILGVDPGTLFMGYAIIHTMGSQVKILDFGVYDVHKLEDQYARLQKEFFFLQELIDKYHPTVLAIESQFVDKNPQTMIKIVHAQGVAIAAALSKDIPVQEYSPMKIKMAITGNGHADKQQVAAMLQRFLHIPDEQMPRKLDATDGMAVALCHWFTTSNVLTRATAGDKRKGLGGDTKSRKGSTSWESFIKSNPDRGKR